MRRGALLLLYYSFPFLFATPVAVAFVAPPPSAFRTRTAAAAALSSPPVPSSTIVVRSSTQQQQQQQQQFEVETTDAETNSLSWWRPPPVLDRLRVGESFCPFLLSEEEDDDDEFNNPQYERETLTITKVSSDPCLFHVRNLVRVPHQHGRHKHPYEEWLMQPSLLSETASTKAGESGREQRSGAAVGWIRWHDDCDDDDEDQEDDLSSPPEATTALAEYLTQLSEVLFVNSDCDDTMTSVEAEPLQLVHYEPGGQYGLHHDSFHRAVTVLHYLNGVAGTWFPFAEQQQERQQCDDKKNARQEQQIPDTLDLRDPATLLQRRVPGRDGIWFVGQEYDDMDEGVKDSHNKAAVVCIQPGDAVVFYNYRQYDDDDEMDDNNDHDDERVWMNWKSLHAALPAKHHEKWIATNWFKNCYTHDTPLVAS